MNLSVEDLQNSSKYHLIKELDYNDLAGFVLDYIRRKSSITVIFWATCLLFLLNAVLIRIELNGSFPFLKIFTHTLSGLIVMPLLIIPIHEIMHIIPFYLTGAKNIRIGVDLKQYLFYVTAHRFVVPGNHFRFIALTPFLLISIINIIMIIVIPGLWKWSLSLLLFVHATMCAGDFALLNFFWLHRNKKILTWDDAEKKTTYFVEEIKNQN